MGGMLGESKYDVIKKIPARYVPKTVLIKIPTDKELVLEKLKHENFILPVIFKPELGERGFMVRRITNENDIALYLNETRTHFLVQEFVDLPMEFGVFYKRFPSEPHGVVSSIVMKEMLTITGDGKATIEDLILNKDRAKLQWKKLKRIYKNQLNDVLPNGKSLELVSVGNHALGTKFMNGNHLINEKLSLTFDQISKQIEGFYFGRYDLRCSSPEDLAAGKFKIMELNGCGAEPAHIYHPGFPISEALKILFEHWRTIFLIARQNHARGVNYISFKEGYELFKRFKSVTK
jgi:hypothetical protein